MKITISREKLNDIVQKTLNIVPARSALPVLSNILFEAGENKILMKATDLDVSITSESEAKVEKQGRITVPGRMFAELVRELPEGEINITGKEKRIELKSEKGIYKLSGIDAEEFPRLPEVDTGKGVRMSGEVLRQMIRKTSFAVPKDDRPALNGILWRAGDDKLTMVATNGHILSKITIAGITITGLEKDIIVPPKALEHFIKLYGDSQDDVELAFGEDNLIFSIGDTVLTTRLLEGPYPNYEQVIPKENDKKILLERDDFYSIIRRVAILSNSITHQVKLGFTKNKVTISATNYDIGGEAQDELALDYIGTELEIGYNANYLIDILKHVDTPQVAMELSGPTSAGVVKPISYNENEEYLFLIMPLRLTD